MMKKIDKDQLLMLVIESRKLSCEEIGTYGMILAQYNDELGTAPLDLVFLSNSTKDMNRKLLQHYLKNLEKKGFINILAGDNADHVNIHLVTDLYEKN